MLFPLDIRRAHRHNVATLRQAPLAEISGALGDLGTLLPLMISLTVQGSINLDSTLVFSGLFNIITGFVFGVPLPVQPMKAIAAAAISRPESQDMASVMAAGQWVGIVVLLLSVTGALRWVTRHIPVPVVKGIQLGAGLSLIVTAGSSLLRHLHWTFPLLDNRLWALAAFFILITTQGIPRFPYALGIFAVAVIFAFLQIITEPRGPRRLPWFEIWHPGLAPFGRWFREGPLTMAIGQLPLTTLNSIIAVSALSADLMPEVPAPSVTALGISIGVMNLTGTWFGAMPMCHGAGGLAAQHRFGARSGASVILLGLLKLVLGVVLGTSLLDLITHFPGSLLGVMVVAAGLELARVGHSLNHGASDLWEQAAAPGGSDDVRVLRLQRSLSDEERGERWTVMLTTAAGILAFRNDAVGFVAGMLCYCAYRVSATTATWYKARNPRGESEPLLSS